MAVVCKAADTEPNAPVALKFLAPRLVSNANLRKRLLSEREGQRDRSSTRWMMLSILTANSRVALIGAREFSKNPDLLRSQLVVRNLAEIEPETD